MSKNSSRLNELGIELYDAIDKDNLHKVGEILNQSFPLDHVFDGCTPLEYSIEKGNVTAVRLLLLKGASAEFGVSSHPLETAILSGRADIVVELLRTGVDTNQELNEEGWTFLIVASNVGILDTVKLLLQYKADANAVTKTGISALSQAAERGYKEIYEILICL